MWRVFISTQLIVKYYTQVGLCTNSVRLFPFYHNRSRGTFHFLTSRHIPFVFETFKYRQLSSHYLKKRKYFCSVISLFSVAPIPVNALSPLLLALFPQGAHSIPSFFIFQMISEPSKTLIIRHKLSKCLQSALYNVKRNGASTVPRGTPVLVHATSNLVPFMETNWGRFVKELKIQCTTEEDDHS